MQSALSLLVDLEPSDADRLLALAAEREVRRADVVIAEGRELSELYIMLEGLVDVRLDALGGHKLGELGPGEILGEVSWLEDRPASATVRVIEDGLVLAIPRARLAALLSSDPAFASRFYRALGRLVARRLHARSNELAAQIDHQQSPSALTSLPAWGAISPVLEGMKDLMIKAEGPTRKGSPGLSPELRAAADQGLAAMCAVLKEHLSPDGALSESVREQVGAMVQRELHPYMLLSRVAQRIYVKPRGYAGDFLTIQWIYDNDSAQSSAVGTLVDYAFLNRPASKAVRNRRGLLAAEIGDAVGRGGHVMSLACGPAAEIFDVFGRQPDVDLKATLIDIDLQALALVADRRDEQGLKRQIRLEQANLVYLATGRAKLDLAPQNLIYSIGLIDYFDDRFVVALLDWIHDRLAPGGKVVLGNFHPRNPDRAFMDYVLAWRLIHRDEQDMNRLFQASKFKAPCSEIKFEGEGVNMFAMGVRA